MDVMNIRENLLFTGKKMKFKKKKNLHRHSHSSVFSNY